MSTRPLLQAYSHRDCELRPMLWHSLSQGFSYIEADVYCFFGQVFVAHDLQQLRPWNTLEKLYLEPLAKHLKNNHNRVFSDDTPLWLFLDVKTSASSSFKTINKVLSSYQYMLSSYQADQRKSGPINIILSGNRPDYELFSRLEHRLVAIDGRYEDLTKARNPVFMPIISDNWQKHFSWQGGSEMPLGEEQKLRQAIRLAHQHGQKLRFWATPDQAGKNRTRLWEKLLTEGIDLINTDDVTGLASFLETKR